MFVLILSPEILLSWKNKSSSVMRCPVPVAAAMFPVLIEDIVFDLENGEIDRYWGRGEDAVSGCCEYRLRLKRVFTARTGKGCPEWQSSPSSNAPRPIPSSRNPSFGSLSSSSSRLPVCLTLPLFVLICSLFRVTRFSLPCKRSSFCFMIRCW